MGPFCLTQPELTHRNLDPTQSDTLILRKLINPTRPNPEQLELNTIKKGLLISLLLVISCKIVHTNALSYSE